MDNNSSQPVYHRYSPNEMKSLLRRSQVVLLLKLVLTEFRSQKSQGNSSRNWSQYKGTRIWEKWSEHTFKRRTCFAESWQSSDFVAKLAWVVCPSVFFCRLYLWCQSDVTAATVWYGQPVRSPKAASRLMGYWQQTMGKDRSCRVNYQKYTLGPLIMIHDEDFYLLCKRVFLPIYITFCCLTADYSWKAFGARAHLQEHRKAMVDLSNFIHIKSLLGFDMVKWV